jgi:hypothetical protein
VDKEIAIFDKRYKKKFQAVIFQVLVIKPWIRNRIHIRIRIHLKRWIRILIHLKCWIWIRILKNNESGSTTLNVADEEDPSPAYGTDVNDVVGGGLQNFVESRLLIVTLHHMITSPEIIAKTNVDLVQFKGIVS